MKSSSSPKFEVDGHKLVILYILFVHRESLCFVSHLWWNVRCSTKVKTCELKAREFLAYNLKHPTRECRSSFSVQRTLCIP